ncbi:decapping 2 [Actinidia rufa]|uniref:Decapping 2 n=1 Tax=Actinidia rufa TaxID=165716 RepID=A0A7J0GV93_9ERIC|nr:decapping 2 [Actinidia rufa]
MSGLHRSSSAPLKNGLPPQELLDDLCSRFVLNVPKEDQQSFERILFLVEYAHWFYEDNSVENNPSLKSFTLKEFTSLMFNSCDVLRPYVAHIDDIFKDFTSYKVRVPVTGAIILDESYERCLLVKGWKGTSWSFPRGKKNKDEEDHTCAIREDTICACVRDEGLGVRRLGIFNKALLGICGAFFICFHKPTLVACIGCTTTNTMVFAIGVGLKVLEETGFDVSKLLNKDEYIEMIFGQQRVRLYIVAGVKDDTAFAPLTKKEISEIAWQRLDELQPVSDDVISRGMNGLKLYMVAPFLASLKAWISAHQPPIASKPDMPLKGISVWKAKNSSIGSNSTITESQPTKPVVDARSSDMGPGASFRNFRFDANLILQAMEIAFSS